MTTELPLQQTPQGTVRLSRARPLHPAKPKRKCVLHADLEALAQAWPLDHGALILMCPVHPAHPTHLLPLADYNHTADLWASAARNNPGAGMVLLNCLGGAYISGGLTAAAHDVALRVAESIAFIRERQARRTIRISPSTPDLPALTL